MARSSLGTWCRIAVAVLVLQVVVVLDGAPPVEARSGGWQPPLDAPVIDPFRPPEHPWGAGNRGLAFGAAPGQPVLAVDAGVVRFAGAVAGRLHVTVDHGSGLWSTYVDVTDLGVVQGQRVAQGQVLARATTAFHLTARLGGLYVDPALLLAGASPIPRLQPSPGPSHGGARSSASRVSGWRAWSPGSLVAGLGRGAAGVTSALVDRASGVADAVAGHVAEGLVGTGRAASFAARWARELAPLMASTAQVVVERVGAEVERVRAFLGLLTDVLPTVRGLQMGVAVREWHRTQDCTPDGRAVAPGGQGRVLVQVGGLGTSPGRASIAKLDPVSLGYDPRDVVAFSYAGGCTDVPFGFDAAPAGSLVEQLDTSTYDPSHTHQDLEVSATRLADLLDHIRSVRPDAPIDVAAHSLGGAVTRRALEILDQRHQGRPPVSVVMTIGSPHQGAELAGIAVAMGSSPVLDRAVAVSAPERLGEARARSVAQLARGTGAQLGPPQAPPDDVRVVSVAGPGDVVVPALNSVWPGAVNAVVPGADEVGPDVHGDLPGRREVHRELALAIAGLPARCVSLAAALGSALVSAAVGTAEAGLGALATGILWG